MRMAYNGLPHLPDYPHPKSSLRDISTSPSIKSVLKYHNCGILCIQLPYFSVFCTPPLKCTSKMSKGYRTPRISGQQTHQNEGAPKLNPPPKVLLTPLFCASCSWHMFLWQLEQKIPYWKLFTNCDKLHILSRIDERQRAGETLRGCSRHFNVQPSQVWIWRKSRGGTSNPLTANQGSLHTGRVSILSGMGDKWLQ